MYMAKLIREPQFEDLFYPADPGLLRNRISELMRMADPVPLQGPVQAALLPHGAYEHCGSGLGRAYASLEETLKTAGFTRVVICAPALYSRRSGVFLSESEIFRSPLGDHPLDEPFSRVLAASSLAMETDEAVHLVEYSIEIHLPFLSCLLGGIPIVPILIGPGLKEAVLRSLASSLHAGELEEGGKSLYIAVSNSSRSSSAEESQKTADLIQNLVLARDAASLLTVSNAPPGIPAWSLILGLLRGRGPVTQLYRGSSRSNEAEDPELVQYTAFCVH